MKRGWNSSNDPHSYRRDVKALGTNAGKKSKLLLCLIWLLEGIVVGFGAILPGISGGTLCVAFGMYRPLIETLSSLKSGIKKYGVMLGIFLLGTAVGFIGLSGIASMLLEKNTTLMTCAFIGFILGTLPELWRDAGVEGRKKSSYASLIISFVVMLGILILLRTKLSLTVAPGIWSYLFCGLLWGLSFIVPGLSSSSLLLFFGLYQPMLEGISDLDLQVLILMGIGMAACILFLSRAVSLTYKKQYSIVSHGVLGIVVATAVMILPYRVASLSEGVLCVLFILGGAAVSFGLSCVCNHLKTKYKEEIG